MNPAFCLLVLAICCVWAPSLPIGGNRLPAWIPVFAAACAAGAYSGVLNGWALLALVGLAAMAYGSRRSRSPGLRALLTTGAGALAFLLALHLVPGFRNPRLFDAIRLTLDAAPFTQYLNFDKAGAGLILLAVYARRCTSLAESRPVLAIASMATAATAVVALTIALMAGYVRADFKLLSQTLPFLGANFFFTCVAEEAFFRGLLQEKMENALAGNPSWKWFPAILSALLFGAAHIGGGLTFCILATIAGFGYAIAYSFTRRIEAAILTHFALNAIQFVGFTYPYLAR